MQKIAADAQKQGLRLLLMLRAKYDIMRKGYMSLNHL